MGQNGELRKRLQDKAQVRIVDRGAKVVIIGEENESRMINDVLGEMLVAVRNGHTPSINDIDYALAEATNGSGSDSSQDSGTPTTDAGGSAGPTEDGLGNVLSATHPVLRADIRVRPRTHGQKHYLETIHSNEMTLAIGPAGTGKTYLGMAAAISALLNKEVKRLVLTRPAVEAGESLGFLPGDLEEKVNPYLRPLYDALYSMVDIDKVHRLMDRQQIEVAPLAFMRGRTLDQAFIILDEAQNTTSEQMMMFLTRLGQGSRAVITGDITQGDLPKGTTSGLAEAQHRLKHIDGIGIVHLTKRDVVRNPLVQRIINAYDTENSDTADSREASS